MADYSTLPNTLAAMGNVVTTPADTEAANKLAQVDRQTRQWLYDFLSKLVDPATDKIRTSAFAGDSIPFGFVRGTNPVDGTQREIAQGTIGTQDLRDDAVTAQKIADQTITSSQIALGGIVGANVADGTLTSAKFQDQIIGTGLIADGAVTQAKLANDSVTKDKLVDGTVTKEKILDGQVTGPKLEPANEGYIMVGGNGVNGNEFAKKQLGGVISVDKDGIATFSGFLEEGQLGFTYIAEKAAAGVDGGNPGTPLVWKTRGTTPGNPWVTINESRALIWHNEGKLYFRENGTYLIEATAPATKVNTHKCRLLVKPNGDSPNYFYIVGTTEYADASDDGSNRSLVKFLVNVQIGQTEVDLPYVELQHMVEALATPAGESWGKSNAATLGEEYWATISFLKLA